MISGSWNAKAGWLCSGKPSSIPRPDLPALVYRKGVFMRKEIEDINGATIAPGSPLDLALQDKGLFLELGHEDYE